MFRYHINAKGEPGLCRAHHQCPFGGSNEHYDSKDEARQAYEQKMNQSNTTAVSDSDLITQTNRKLATLQTITDVKPIEGADRIELAKVGGWNVVIGKGQFHPGDKAVYVEIDSILPEDNPAFGEFQKRGQKEVFINGQAIKGHVLKTIRLRGVYSQGLLLDPMEVLEADVQEGTDVTQQLGIHKYEAPLPVGASNIIGPFQARFAPKTDAVRLQNLTEHWDDLKQVQWEPTLKVDGTSQTLVNDNGTLRIFGRNWELDPDSSAGLEVAKKYGLDQGLESGDAIQFEMIGAGIQGNGLKLNGNQPAVFALWRNGEKQSRSMWSPSAQKNAVPVLGSEYAPQNFSTPDELIDFVDGLRGNFTKDARDEGVVYHPLDPSSLSPELQSVLDRNGNFKVISNAFLSKQKD